MAPRLERLGKKHRRPTCSPKAGSPIYRHRCADHSICPTPHLPDFRRGRRDRVSKMGISNCGSACPETSHRHLLRCRRYSFPRKSPDLIQNRGSYLSKGRTLYFDPTIIQMHRPPPPAGRSTEPNLLRQLSERKKWYEESEVAIPIELSTPEQICQRILLSLASS